MRLLVIDAVGLRYKDLKHAPALSALARDGFAAPQQTIFPALTCSVQATWLTGLRPAQHGIVANGWYFRDQAEIWLWRQANSLVQGEKFYEKALAYDPNFRCAKMFWWYNMYANVSHAITPRPEYWADGLKLPGLYSHPASLEQKLQEQLGPFPLFNFWGPAADIRSTRWIADASVAMMEQQNPDLLLAYLPHLDYDHQRWGPEHPKSIAAIAELDREASKLIEVARAKGAEVIVMSEYGIEKVETPVFINRALHEAGLLQVQETQHGQLLDAGASQAFAVADHQVAHIYIRQPKDHSQVLQLLKGLPGVGQLWDRDAQREQGIDHERSGELVAVAEPGCWFAYHYWLDEARRPDFATTVDIHRKPGYDPTELFVDPKLRFPKLRIARRLLQKKLGMRYLMDVIGTDPRQVRGSHGRLFESEDEGPVYICSSTKATADRVVATEVHDRILRLL